MLDPGEECDDGPSNGNDAACTDACEGAVCGDGLVWAGEEQCDDGDAENFDGCGNGCLIPTAKVTAGFSHTCGISDTGVVRCWGGNDQGQLGYGNILTLGDAPGELPTPDVSVDGGGTYQLAAGQDHNCAVVAGGAVRCWGDAQYGQLGYGSTNDQGNNAFELPTPDVDVGGPVVEIAPGGEFTCALLEGGAVRCWGYGVSLGYGNTENLGDQANELPTADVDLGGEVAVHIDAGNGHTCAVFEGGSVR